jgi:CFEM domain
VTSSRRLESGGVSKASSSGSSSLSRKASGLLELSKCDHSPPSCNCRLRKLPNPERAIDLLNAPPGYFNASSVPTLISLQQTCVKNMLGLAPSLGCSANDAACLCKNANFGYGIRDCSNAACGEAVASTVIAYGNSYCSCESTFTLLTEIDSR